LKEKCNLDIEFLQEQVWENTITLVGSKEDYNDMMANKEEYIY
jgi:hypothetical protein